MVSGSRRAATAPLAPNGRRRPANLPGLRSEHAERRRRRLSENAYKDLVWWLRCGMDHFGPYELEKIDEVVIEDFVQDMLAEREEIRAAAAAGRPLMQTICLPNGRTYQRRRKALSNDSINKAIAAVRQVLKDASHRYPRHVVRNPAADRDVYLARPPAKCSYLGRTTSRRFSMALRSSTAATARSTGTRCSTSVRPTRAR